MESSSVIQRQRQDFTRSFQNLNDNEALHYSRNFFGIEGWEARQPLKKIHWHETLDCKWFQSGRKYIINDTHLMTVSYMRHSGRMMILMKFISLDDCISLRALDSNSSDRCTRIHVKVDSQREQLPFCNCFFSNFLFFSRNVQVFPLKTVKQINQNSPQIASNQTNINYVLRYS